jgi:hypothetical protein
MAQAADQHTASEWNLTQLFHYLCVELGREKERALYEMEQRRLRGHLKVIVQEYDAGGNPKGKPFDLGTNKKNELVYAGVWVYPLRLPWGEFRCTVTEQNARALWPAPPALQSSETTVASPLKPKAWLLVEHERRKQQNNIPKDITTYGQQLHEAAVEAMRQKCLTNAPSARRFETLLHDMDLFPKIQRRTKHARNTHD